MRASFRSPGTKLTISRGDKEASKRKKTEGNHVVTLQHPVLGQDPHHSRGWKTPAAAQWGKVRNKGCRAHKRKVLQHSPKFHEGKGICKLTAPGEVFQIFSRISMNKTHRCCWLESPDGGERRKKTPRRSWSLHRLGKLTELRRK